MIRTILAGALALALSACATTPPTVTAPSAAQIAAGRLAAETGYDSSLLGLEQSIKSGALTGSAAADARTSLLASYAVLVAGRASLAASAVADPALVSAQQQVDRDYAHVIAELPPS